MMQIELREKPSNATLVLTQGQSQGEPVFRFAMAAHGKEGTFYFAGQDKSLVDITTWIKSLLADDATVIHNSDMLPIQSETFKHADVNGDYPLLSNIIVYTRRKRLTKWLTYNLLSLKTESDVNLLTPIYNEEGNEVLPDTSLEDPIDVFNDMVERIRRSEEAALARNPILSTLM